MGHNVLEPRGCVGDVDEADRERFHVQEKPTVPSGVPCGFNDIDGTLNVLKWYADSK